MTGKSITVTLQVWRQKNAGDPGGFETYEAKDISTDLSFLDMLDVVNEKLARDGKEPIAFDHDCREGICGQCGCMVNGRAHGHEPGTTLCQLHMRSFDDGDTIVVEPFRARAFKVVKDLMVDRSALDTIIQAGGYVSVNAGSAPEANAMPIPQPVAEKAMDAAACIGCGACVASCPNASAMLFAGAKISQLSLLPQGKPEAAGRALSMIRAMDAQGFGICTDQTFCEADCPKNISLEHIARANREFLKASFLSEGEEGQRREDAAPPYTFEPIYDEIPEQERAALSQHFSHQLMGDIALEWSELMRETFQEGHEIIVFKIRKAGAFIGLGILSIIRHLDPAKYIWKPVAALCDLVATFDVGFLEIPVSNLPGLLTVKGIDAEERGRILHALYLHIKEFTDLNVLCVKVGEVIIAYSLLLQGGNTLFFKAVGLDYELSYNTKAYFNLYYATLDYAAQQGCTQIDFGVTSYHFKQWLGCDLYPAAYLGGSTAPFISWLNRPLALFVERKIGTA